MTREDFTIDLTHVIHRLTRLRDLAEELDETVFAEGPGKSTENRLVNQRMNYLADSLDLVASLVRAEYWTGKGMCE